MIEVYTDGTVTKNPGGDGRGGWLVKGHDHVFLTKIYSNTTSNRMELTAIIFALANQPLDSNVIVYTDSSYCVKSFRYVEGKTIRDSVISKLLPEKPIPKEKPNHDLLECLREAIKLHKTVDVLWVRGHDGNIYNERVDKAIRIQNRTRTQK